MIRRLSTTLSEFIAITDGPQPVELLVEDEGYEDGDCVYFTYHNEEGELKWLAARNIILIDRSGANMETDECIITLD